MLTAALMLAQLAAPPPVLSPLGKWSVDYGDSQCVVSRQFGDKGHPVTFAFQSVTGELAGDFFLIVDGAVRDNQRGQATVTFNTGRTYSVPWVSASAKPGTHVVRMVPGADFWDALPQATSMQIERVDKAAFGIPIAAMTRVAAATKSCGDSLLRSWGADPEKMVDAPPGDLVKWFAPADYPAAALRANQHGQVQALTTVGPDGKPSACRVVVSSGVPPLDEVTCRSIMTRASFASAATPVRYFYRAVTWLIPAR